MIVLLDLMMPRLDGAGLLGTVAGDTRRLRRHRYILMTASHQTLSLAFVHLLSDLSVPVVHKPFNMDKLLEIIASQSPKRREAPRAHKQSARLSYLPRISSLHLRPGTIGPRSSLPMR